MEPADRIAASRTAEMDGERKTRHYWLRRFCCAPCGSESRQLDNLRRVVVCDGLAQWTVRSQAG